MNSELYRQLPSVEQILQTRAAIDLITTYGRPATLDALRTALESARQEIRAGRKEPVTDSALLAITEAQLGILTRPSIRPVINATGVIIHTNLGRSPLSPAAQQAIANAAQNYNTLEYDLETGQRGSRSVHASHLLTRITGAEAATVVNNNASAILLTLAALTRGKEVIISRGQLVEIGGSFRIPDVMAQSGATLVEVGTTNRTHLRDYEGAISERTAAIMVAHHSNFRIVGFTTEPDLADLGTLAQERGIYLLHDLGSGTLLETADYGLAHEPTVQESLAAGTDIACFSGDKLLGGPQAGLIIGKRELVAHIKSHPLARAVRPDKLCLAGLSATLLHYVKNEAPQQIPIWQMIAHQQEDLRRTARRWSRRLRKAGVAASIMPGESTVGGGSLPGATLPTWLVGVQHPQPDKLAARLRVGQTPIIGRIEGEQFLLDPRTVLPQQEKELLNSLILQTQK